jgi:hypothetical protein
MKPQDSFMVAGVMEVGVLELAECVSPDVSSRGSYDPRPRDLAGI